MTQVSLYLLFVLEIIWNCSLVKKAMNDLDCSETSDPDCIPVVVLKNHSEPELSHILAYLFKGAL